MLLGPFSQLALGTQRDEGRAVEEAEGKQTADHHVRVDQVE